MLKELQEFASRGCIDIGEVKQETKKIQEHQEGENLDENIQQKRDRVFELIKHLRQQLEDLEKFAYENGEGELPMSELRHRQKIVFEKLQEKIQLKIELDKHSEHELQKNVDEGLNQVHARFFFTPFLLAFESDQRKGEGDRPAANPNSRLGKVRWVLATRTTGPRFRRDPHEERGNQIVRVDRQAVEEEVY